MPKYVSFFSYTADAWSHMIDRPENRAVAARALIEGIGGTMEAFYWTVGDWDGLVIYEVPDPKTASAFSARVLSSGLVKGVKTEQLIGMEEVRGALETARAASAVYAPPGSVREWRSDYEETG